MEKMIYLIIPVLCWVTSCNISVQGDDLNDADEGSLAWTLSPPEPGDVYVVGSQVEYDKEGSLICIPTIWKNGIEQKLTDGASNAFANSVYVTGNDVYVAGFEGNVAIVWKNGEAQKLTGNRLTSTRATSIFVSGNDVYVAGIESVRDVVPSSGRGMGSVIYAAVFWKNGIVQYLTDGTYGADAASIFISGNDIYVAGYENCGQQGGTEISGFYNLGVATLWRNNDAQRLTDGLSNASACSVFVSGEDIYVVGHLRDNTAYESAVVWKNGIPQILTDGSVSVEVTSVYVLGNDVYVAGHLNSVATVWKNGDAQHLSDGTSNSYAHSIFVSREDVYVIGNETTDKASSAAFWKNGIAQRLANSTFGTMIYSIFVVE